MSFRRSLSHSRRLRDSRTAKARALRRVSFHRGLQFETLEERQVLATMFAVTEGNNLLRFDSSTPGTIDDSVAITGLAMGETILGIDFRPADGQLYAVTSADEIYTINVNTGAATNASTLSAATTGTTFGLDFNPVADRLRLTSDADENLRVDVATGTVTADTALQYAVGDPNQVANPNVVASAYNNSFAGAATTTLYGIDSNLDILVQQNPPDDGTLTTVGTLGINTTEQATLDISAADGIAYASLTAPAATVSQLFTLNLGTGAATLLGTIGGSEVVIGLAAAPVLVVTTTADAGAGSLRAAIDAANLTIGVPETILFDIPGVGPHTIEPLSALPNITDPVVIDGTSEPDFVSTPVVILDGSSAGAAVAGLTIVAGASTVQGLRIQDFTGAGIVLDTLGDNTIGGPAPGQGNIFTGNDGAGVLINGGSGNLISQNSIFANGGLGIDLAPVGVTPNDADDSDVGANNLQNFPVLTLATSAGGTTSVQGTLTSTPNTTFVLEFYSNAAADGSGNGEGQTYLGTLIVMTNGAGVANFSPMFGVAVANGQFVTATATDPSNNTSEFSAALEVQPTITISDVTVAEGDAGTTPAVFDVVLSSPSGDPVEVIFTTADGTATQPGDYAATTDTLTFAAGETSMRITVQVNGDVVAEGDETFLVNLSGATGARIVDGEGVGTITDDEPVPSLSINDVTQAEGDAGVTNAIFTVTLSTASASPVTVVYTTADVTAASPTDYTAQTGTLTFAPGDTTRTVTIAINGDFVDEPNETFQVNLSLASGATLGDAQGIGTIADNDPAPTVAINDVAVFEGNEGPTNLVFTVSLTSASGVAVTVQYTTANGSAQAPGDYAAQSGTLTFAPGQTQRQITIVARGETTNEIDENFFVNLSNPSGATVSDAQGVGLLLNDDAPQFIVTGASQGGGPRVRVFNPNNGTAVHDFYAFDPNFLGGVAIATGDFNQDGVADIVAAAGPGGGPHVRVFDGVTGQQLPGAIGSFFAYSINFTGGVWVAAADMNADGIADVITGAGQGGGPHVRVFNGANGALLADFFAYDSAFAGGVRVAVGDVISGGAPEIITGAGPGGGPHVRVFNAAGGQIGDPSGSFFPYNPAFTGGVFVAAADVNDDGQVDIITGAGQGGGPHVRTFNGATGVQLAEPAGNFFAYEITFTGGVRVGAGNITGDGGAEIITGAGPGGTARLRAFRGPDLAVVSDFPAYETTFSGGLFVAGTTAGLMPLLAAGTPASAGPSGGELRSDQLTNELLAAVERRLGVSLQHVNIAIADLPDGRLGAAAGNVVLLDRDAAGFGWFVDPTPLTDEEFTISANNALPALDSGPAAGRIDLLSALAHEIGHLLGLDHHDAADQLMSATLAAGERRIEPLSAIDRLFASDW